MLINSKVFIFLRFRIFSFGIGKMFFSLLDYLVERLCFLNVLLLYKNIKVYCNFLELG